MGDIARTYLLDQIVMREVARGVDLVVNLAAGLDTRPYRMDLPPALHWVEADLPQILDYKEPILGGPRRDARSSAFESIPPTPRRVAHSSIRPVRSARHALVISEGLVIYLASEDVRTLAGDLSAVAAFERWALDCVSPRCWR